MRKLNDVTFLVQTVFVADCHILLGELDSAEEIGQTLSNNDEALEAYEQALEFVVVGIESYELMNAAVLTVLFLGLLELKDYDQSNIVKLLQFIANGHRGLSEGNQDNLLAPFFKFIAIRVDCKLEVERLKQLVTV